MNDNILTYSEYHKMLAHATVCGLSFIEPGEHLPSLILENPNDEIRNSLIQQYVAQHRLWSRLVWIGRNN